MNNDDSFYKYLPIERISYINDQLLRFTQPEDLNDPFECYPKSVDKKIVLDKVLNVISTKKNVQNPLNIIKIEDTVLQVLKDYLPDTFDKINKEIGILSLSKIWKSSLMWSHYCESHTGFCIGFSKSHKYFKDYLSEDLHQSQYTKSVNYQTDRSEINLDSKHPKSNFKILHTKSKEWQYEKEIRVIKTLNLKDCIKKNKKGSHDLYLFKVPHYLINEIIIGVKTPLGIKNDIIEFCKQKNIKIYQATISETTFDMEREEIITTHNE